MPIYDYKCRECEEVWDTTHSFKETAEELGITCPSCGSSNIFRYLGRRKTIPIHFKGSGFAINDLALDRIGFPKHYKQNKEVRDKLKDI